MSGLAPEAADMPAADLPAVTFAFAATSANVAEAAQHGEDELGIWAPAPAWPHAAGFAAGFGLAAQDAQVANEDVSLWQVTLPADHAASAAALGLAQARLRRAEAALPFARDRLAAFVAAGGPAPALPPGLEAPELALFDTLATEESGQAALGVAAFDQVGAFFARVQDALRSFAAIDTVLADQGRIGLTVVSWTGDFRTVWPRGLALAEAERHAAAVHVALRTRDAWLRLGATVTRGALQVATLLSVSPVLAVPAAYRFVRQVIDQVQALGGLPRLV
jgi:hypothetical protein